VPMLAESVDVVIGVDTHADTHTAAMVSAATGGVLAEVTVAATAAGYAELVAFAEDRPGRRAWAVEGTASYGVGLTRHLQGAGEDVVEVERPHRPKRRRGKSDAIDAVRGARDALAMAHLAQPRSGGTRAALAATLSVRRSAIEARSDAQRQLRSMVITAPEALRARFRDLTGPTAIVAAAARLRPQPAWGHEAHHTAIALRALARRIRALSEEITDHDTTLTALVTSWRPDLLAEPGIGPVVAATILCAWSHPGRCRSEAAFANLAGTAPLDASSGRHQHHRLNRGGDRQLNNALHVIALCRLRNHPATRAYAERRRQEPNMTDRKIRRCLKRYIARDIYKLLEAAPPTLDRT
jgi:transposase